MAPLGKLLLITGTMIAAVGLLLVLADKLGGPGLGRLPGDITIRRENFTFYFPLGTSIVISVLLSLLFWILRK